MNGGKFAEAVFRVIEWQDTGGYTPLGKQIDRARLVSRVQQNTSLPDSLRLQIPALASGIADIRNKRDVAHLAGSVEVNEMDANLVMSLASWILAELIRLAAQIPPNEIQRLIDGLIERQIPVVEDIDGDLVVLNTSLSATDRAFVLLYRKHPDRITLNTLQLWLGYQNKSRLKKLLKKHEKGALVHINENGVRLTSKGTAHVENNIPLRVEL